MSKAGLDTQEIKSISSLDNVATLMHFLFPQTKQQYMVSSVLILSPVEHAMYRGWKTFEGQQIRLTMCRTAQKHLLHLVVYLFCDLGSMGLLPGEIGKYLNPLPTPYLLAIQPYMSAHVLQSWKNLLKHIGNIFVN